MLLGAKCSEKGPPRRLPSCAERRAGTASAALSHPPPPPRRAGRIRYNRLPAPAAPLACTKPLAQSVSVELPSRSTLI